MKKTYKVVFNEQVFKRTTERTYTHVVIARRNPEHVRKMACIPNNKNNLKFYTERAQGTGTIYSWETPESIARDVAKGNEILAMGIDAYIDWEIAQSLAKIDESIAKGNFDAYFEDGWCGRLDLAQKKAASLRNTNYKGVAAYQDIEILEVAIAPTLKGSK